MYSISASFQRALTNRRNFLIYLIRLVSLFETNFKWIYIYIYSAIVRRVRYDHVFYIVPLVLNIEVIDNRVSRLNCRKVGRRGGRGGREGGRRGYIYLQIYRYHTSRVPHIRFVSQWEPNGKRKIDETSKRGFDLTRRLDSKVYPPAFSRIYYETNRKIDIHIPRGITGNRTPGIVYRKNTVISEGNRAGDR